MTQTNCHNCGAPITGSICEYCGTRFNIRVVEPEIESVKLEIELSALRAAEAHDAAFKALLGMLSPNEARRRVGLG